MLFRPKKVNEGFDRIFFVAAVIAALLLGSYMAIGESNTVVETASWDDNLPSYYTWSETKEARGDVLEKAKAYAKLEERALKQFYAKTRELESQGYHESYVRWDRKHKKYVLTTEITKHIWFYPPISRCVAAGALYAGIGFLIAFVSFRALALLVLWIKQGFSKLPPA
jgi:hypothetical protein